MDGPEGKSGNRFTRDLENFNAIIMMGLILTGIMGILRWNQYPFIIYVEILLLACRPGLDSNLCQSFHIGTYVFLGSTMEEDH